MCLCLNWPVLLTRLVTLRVRLLELARAVKSREVMRSSAVASVTHTYGISGKSAQLQVCPHVCRTWLSCQVLRIAINLAESWIKSVFLSDTRGWDVCPSRGFTTLIRALFWWLDRATMRCCRVGKRCGHTGPLTRKVRSQYQKRE